MLVMLQPPANQCCVPQVTSQEKFGHRVLSPRGVASFLEKRFMTYVEPRTIESALGDITWLSTHLSDAAVFISKNGAETKTLQLFPPKHP